MKIPYGLSQLKGMTMPQHTQVRPECFGGWMSTNSKVLDHKKFAAISVPLNEIGKMVGGWKKSLE